MAPARRRWLALLALAAAAALLAALLHRPAGRVHGPLLVFHVPGVGRGSQVCVSLWGWLPNGTLAPLGWACGTGAAAVPAGSVNAYLAAWRSLAGPGVEPGVLAMVAVTRPDGYVYGYAKSLLPGPRGVQGVVDVGLTPAEARDMLREPLARWIGPGGAAWRLRGMTYSGGVPLILGLLRLRGYLEHFRGDTASLHLRIESSRGLPLVFEAVAALRPAPGGETRWVVAGPAEALSLDTVLASLTIVAGYSRHAEPLYQGSAAYTQAPLDAAVRAWIAPLGPGGDALVAAGLVGDTLVARYCLQPLQGPGYGCLATAAVAMARPRLVRGHAVYWYEVDNNPEDGRGLAEKLLHGSAGGSGLEPTPWVVVRGTLAVNYLPADNPYTAPALGLAAPILSPAAPYTAIGTTRAADTLVTRVVLTAYEEPGVAYRYRLLHPAHPVHYQGHIYRLGAAYFDVEVAPPATAPQR